MPDELEQIGDRSIQKWGSMVVNRWADTIIPVHGDPWKGANYPIPGRCRCRIVGGFWVHEPDACPTCKQMAEIWNSMFMVPVSFEES